ncbi:protein-glutamate O-methyltransferase CheR [Marinobacteraceae bacterium S3BR75-40.1]
MADCNEPTAKGIWSLQKMPEMDDAQFRQWQELLETRTGMTLSPERRSFLQANLGIRMREVGCDSYQAYYEKVVSGPEAVVEWATLVDRLTVQETRFFRDPDAFKLVSDFVQSRSRERLKEKPIEAWSVGCATGEEAYTLAILIQASLDEHGIAGYFGITGTDISQPALVKARKGLYNARKLVTTDESLQSRYFVRHDNNTFEVSPELREHVCFSRLNILELQKAPMHGMDIIFCQNVLIYFRRWRRREIANRLAERLAPGGILVLGQGELTDWHHPELQRLPSENVLAWIRRQPRNE